MSKIISNVGYFYNLTEFEKEELNSYAQENNMSVEHREDESVITFPNNTYYPMFKELCNRFNQTITQIRQQKIV